MCAEHERAKNDDVCVIATGDCSVGLARTTSKPLRHDRAPPPAVLWCTVPYCTLCVCVCVCGGAPSPVCHGRLHHTSSNGDIITARSARRPTPCECSCKWPGWIAQPRRRPAHTAAWTAVTRLRSGGATRSGRRRHQKAGSPPPVRMVVVAAAATAAAAETQSA